MRVLYTIPEIVDELTNCQRRLKEKGTTTILQPLIAQVFDDYMGGVDVA